MAMEVALPVSATVSGLAVLHGQMERGYYLSSAEACDCDRLDIAGVADHHEKDPCRDEHTERVNLQIESGLPPEISTA